VNRRTLIGVAAAWGSFSHAQSRCQRQTSLKTKNVVFVHGLFADGSCWSKVIARLQQKGINCTQWQNPLTSCMRLRRPRGGDRGAVGSNGARRPLFLRNDRVGGGAGPEDLRPRLHRCAGTRCRRGLYGAGKELSDAPATAGIIFNDDWGQLSETAFLHDFAGDLPPEEARVLYAVQQPFRSR